MHVAYACNHGYVTTQWYDSNINKLTVYIEAKLAEIAR